MQSANQLGIYLRKDRATVVCLAAHGREKKLLDCFSVRVEGEEASPQILCDRVAHACNERKVRFGEAAVALDCADFMQHAVHSEFSDPRKVAATVRFDTEEMLATDVSDVAVTFRIASTDEEGAQLEVFTAPRPVLTSIIESLQINGIDPIAIDPDVYCLSRYFCEYAQEQGEAEGSTLYAVLSDCRGYLVVLSGQRELVTFRTFLIGSSQDRTSLLSREALVTAALASANPVRRICAYDVAGGTALQSVGEKMGLSGAEYNVVALSGVSPEEIPDCPVPADLALAYGAALGLSEKANSVNFRNDHMPFLGKKMRLQKAVRFLSLSLTILLLAVGVLFHSQLIRVNRNREAVRVKFEPEYLAVMPGKTELPATMKQGVADLERTKRIINAEKTGVGGDQEAVSAKITLLLAALNKCAEKTNSSIDSVTISGSNITVNGSTSSRQNTNLVFDAMAQQGLEVGNNTIGANGEFSVTLKIKKQVQGT